MSQDSIRIGIRSILARDLRSVFCSIVPCSLLKVLRRLHAYGVQTLWHRSGTLGDGHPVAEVQEYIAKLEQSAGYATAFMVPYQMDTVDGIILLTSTRGSTCQLARNSATALEGGIISDPHWSYFDVWWYPELVTLNFHGITDPKYAGTQLDVNFGELLTRRLGPDWRNNYTTFAVGWYLDSLRSVLGALNAYNWAEIVIGSSWRGFRVLDFYIRMMSSGVPARIEEAWYLLQATVPL